MKIELTEHDAIRYREFMQYYDTFNLLVKKGVFDVKNGSVALHFDKNGELKIIQRADVLFDAKHEYLH